MFAWYIFHIKNDFQRNSTCLKSFEASNTKTPFYSWQRLWRFCYSTTLKCVRVHTYIAWDTRIALKSRNNICVEFFCDSAAARILLMFYKHDVYWIIYSWASKYGQTNRISLNSNPTVNTRYTWLIEETSEWLILVEVRNRRETDIKNCLI